MTSSESQPRTRAGRALLEQRLEQAPNAADPSEEWVAQWWADQNDLEAAILRIEAEAAQDSRLDVLSVLAAIESLQDAGRLSLSAYRYDNPAIDRGVALTPRGLVKEIAAEVARLAVEKPHD